MREPRLGARSFGARRALHGPRLPSSEKSGNGSPLGVPGLEEPGGRERPRERVRGGAWGERCAGSRCVRTFTLIQP